jgi:hypothetical protein
VPLVRPHRAAHGVESEREVVLVEWTDRDSEVGWGECPTLSHPGYVIGTTDEAWRTLVGELGPSVASGSWSADGVDDTDRGARTAADLKWVFADIDIKEITVSYRQSKQLNDFARAMILAVGGTEQNVSLPAHVDSTGVSPSLLEHAVEMEMIVGWLANRIREIERFVGQLPSIAIFVNAESNVAPMAEALNAALVEHNIQVIACREGQAVGQEGNVRVFDVRHIKGLEFEAVFFVGLDQLADAEPDLFDKFLYVGATRAATYLGATVTGAALPERIIGLGGGFEADWRS